MRGLSVLLSIAAVALLGLFAGGPPANTELGVFYGDRIVAGLPGTPVISTPREATPHASTPTIATPDPAVLQMRVAALETQVAALETQVATQEEAIPALTLQVGEVEQAVGPISSVVEGFVALTRQNQALEEPLATVEGLIERQAGLPLSGTPAAPAP